MEKLLKLRYDIPLQPSEGPEDGFVTIVKCANTLEADGIVRLLDRAGIRSQIQDKLGIAMSCFADLRNDYPSIAIRVARKSYSDARQLLIRVL